MFYDTEDGPGASGMQKLRGGLTDPETRVESLRETVDRLEKELQDYKTLCRIAFSIIGKSPRVQKVIAEDSYNPLADQDDFPNTRDFTKALLRISTEA